jgi:uncharacterized protein DUF6884
VRRSQTWLCFSTMEIEPNSPRTVLVGCASRKLPHRAPAMDFYISDLFRKRRAYAEASGHAWFVLSAKYGLVRPDTMLDQYDETLDHFPRAVLLSWGEKAVSDLEQILGPLAGHMVEIHAGKRYSTSMLVPARLSPDGTACLRLLWQTS